MGGSSWQRGKSCHAESTSDFVKILADVFPQESTVIRHQAVRPAPPGGWSEDCLLPPCSLNVQLVVILFVASFPLCLTRCWFTVRLWHRRQSVSTGSVKEQCVSVYCQCWRTASFCLLPVLKNSVFSSTASVEEQCVFVFCQCWRTACFHLLPVLKNSIFVYCQCWRTVRFCTSDMSHSCRRSLQILEVEGLLMQI